MLFTLMANDKLLDNTFNILFFAPFASFVVKTFTNDKIDKSIKHINSVFNSIEKVLDNRKVKTSTPDQVQIVAININPAVIVIKTMTEVINNVKELVSNEPDPYKIDYQYEIDDVYSLAYDSHNLSKHYLHEEVIDFLYKNTYKNRS